MNSISQRIAQADAEARELDTIDDDQDVHDDELESGAEENANKQVKKDKKNEKQNKVEQKTNDDEQGEQGEQNEESEESENANEGDVQKVRSEKRERPDESDSGSGINKTGESPTLEKEVAELRQKLSIAEAKAKELDAIYAAPVAWAQSKIPNIQIKEPSVEEIDAELKKQLKLPNDFEADPQTALLNPKSDDAKFLFRRNAVLQQIETEKLNADQQAAEALRQTREYEQQAITKIKDTIAQKQQQYGLQEKDLIDDLQFIDSLKSSPLELILTTIEKILDAKYGLNNKMVKQQMEEKMVAEARKKGLPTPTGGSSKTASSRKPSLAQIISEDDSDD